MPQTPEAIIFNNPGDNRVIGDLILEGVSMADWEAQIFANPQHARDALNEETGALITSLGFPRILGGKFPAEIIIERSENLGISKAIVSGHPDASRFVKSTSADILIPKSDFGKIPSSVADWLATISLGKL